MNIKKNHLRQDAQLMAKGAVLIVPGTEIYHDKHLEDGETPNPRAGKVKAASFVVAAKWNNEEHAKAAAAFLRKTVQGSSKHSKDDVYKSEDDRQFTNFIFLGWLMPEDGPYTDETRDLIEVECLPWTDGDDDHPFPPTYQNRLKLATDPEMEPLRRFITKAAQNDDNYAKRYEEDVTKNS